MLIQRKIAQKVEQYTTQYPVVTITGPRQSGKTTLCKMLFKKHEYVNLEDIEQRNFALEDPHGFLSRFSGSVIIDEVQKAPDLLSYIQVDVDQHQSPGKYILTGSQNFVLLETISQSLAGRTALATLLPFSYSEIKTSIEAPSLNQVLYAGGYPRIYDMNLNPTEASAFYIGTYVERDLRQLINVRDLSRFETFLKMCAGRTGQLLNLSSLGNDCGVNYNTIKSWISILEASFIVKLLPPYYRNFNKRLVKSPKLYFLDTGLAAFLLGIQHPDHLENHPLRGALFETFVISELLKQRFNRGRTDNLHFFRDNKGDEVDVVLDHGMVFRPVEIKAGQTVVSDFFKGLRYLERISDQVDEAYLIYGGSESRKQQGVQVVSWQDIDAVKA